MPDGNIPCDAGRYELGDVLGRGGMATVHAGTLRGPNGFTRKVAIKRLHPHVARQEHLIKMMVDEARIASRLRHPNIVPVIDFIEIEGRPALILEYVDGWPLSRLLANGGRVPPPIALGIAQGLLQGLQHVHTVRDSAGRPMNAVHRDVSPQNVLIARDGVARLTDFGVARARGRLVHTQTGEIKGKLAYAAPELAVGEIDQRADIYAVGVVLWEMLCGVRFAEGSGLWELGARGDAPIPRPSQLAPDVTTAVDAIVLKALCGDRALRFASAMEMADAIEARARAASARQIMRWAREQSCESPESSDAAPPVSRRVTIRVDHDELTTPILAEAPPEAEGPATTSCPVPTRAGEWTRRVAAPVFAPPALLRDEPRSLRWPWAVAGVCVAIASGIACAAALVARAPAFELPASPPALLQAESRVAVRRTPHARDDGRLPADPAASIPAQQTPGIDPLPAIHDPVEHAPPIERTERHERRDGAPGPDSCDPPYREDERGIRIYKPSCVRSPATQPISAAAEEIVQPW